MRTDRPYRKALSYEVAMAELLSVSGRQLDPSIVDALQKIVAVEALADSGVASQVDTAQGSPAKEPVTPNAAGAPQRLPAYG
jgi:HD-GYP domain-containing protein (c-di-GMP phosphodiesterase class II)